MAKIYSVFLVLFILLSGAAAVADDEQVQVFDESYVVPYLQQVIAWHRGITSVEVSPNNAQEILIDETLRKNSAKALSYAFDFARAEAAVLESAKIGPVMPGAENNSKANLQKIADAAEQNYKDTQGVLENIDKQIAKATAAKRPALVATRAKLESELKLIKARQDLLQTVISSAKTTTTTNNKDSSLVGKINNLAKTVPEIQNEETKNAKTENGANIVIPQAAASVATSKGIIGLTGDLYSAYGKKREIDNLSVFTTKLRDQNQKIMDALRVNLKAKVTAGDELAKSTDGATAEQINGQKQQLDAMVLDFKKLSTIVIPLSQTNIWLDGSKRNLDEWDNVLGQQLNEIFHHLLARLVVLGIAILIPIFLSVAAQRAINRYVQNPLRQRQLKTARRIIFVALIAIIVLFNLISESGSLVTFAGFLTAGLAVALQTVILSLVAHFFFFGRYGISVGDRVNVGNVTGEIIKIGMVRFYLMELAGTDFELSPTGKIVGYPNSVLFQPAAFIKLVPGTNYVWNEIKLVLNPLTDYQLANKKLMEAVDKIYADYREAMQRQEMALQRATHTNVKIPAPRAHLRFTDAGLAFVVRYPIEIGKAIEAKDRITRELLETIKNEPQLKVA